MNQFAKNQAVDLSATTGAGTDLNYNPVSAQGVTAKLRKGESAASMPTTTLVLDTGQPSLPAPEQRQPKSQDELDQLYRDTISSREAIDHHGIDSCVRFTPELQQHCATGMIVLAPELVLEQLRDRGVTEITAHQDSDLDSLASSYLAQSLLQLGTLPSMAKSLAEHADLVDFGRYRDPDPANYVRSLAGVIGALARVSNEQAREMSGTVWRGEGSVEEKRAASGKIAESFQQQLISDAFDVFNACEKHCRATGKLDCTDISDIVATLHPTLREPIEAGQKSFLKDIEQFEREHARAARTVGTVIDRQGNAREVPVLLFDRPELSPLVVTNLCYLREEPETIVAVYAGQNRTHGGDCYDIGIKSETAQATFGLEFLAEALCKAEVKAREPLLADLRAKQAAETITDDEAKKLDVLTTPRKGFEHLQIGDPTVCVAGGSLVAASNNALISGEQFARTVRNALKCPE